MPLELVFKDKQVIDPIEALFHTSVKLSEYAMAVRNRATGTTVDVGGGVSGSVTSVDGRHMHVRTSNGSKHDVPFTSRKLLQLAETGSKKGGTNRRSPSSRAR